VATNSKGALMEAGSNKEGGLHRGIAFFGAILLTISAISPASAMFIVIPGAINQAGTGVVYSLLIATTIGLIMSLVYGELASAYPSAGGEYVMVAKILGPLPSYVTLVLNVCIMTLISAVLAVGIGNYFAAILPALPPVATSVAAVAVAAGFAILNINLNAWVTGIFLAVELACIGFIAFLSGTHIQQPVSLLLHPTMATAGALRPADLSTMLVATATVVFAFNGYEQAVYLAEEIRNVRKVIARVIIASLLITVAFEFLPTMLMLLASNDVAAAVQSPSPFQDLVTRLAGSTAGKLISACVSLAVFNACIVNILMTSRFIYSTGRDGFWGAQLGRRFADVHKQQGTPWFATLIVAGFCAIACFIPLNALLVLTGTGLLAVYMILCVCVMRGRAKGLTAGTGFRMPFYPAVPILGILLLAGIAAANWLDPVIGRPSLVVTMIEVMAAIAVYFAVRHFKGGATLSIIDPE
jgi:amino acid transporter